LQIDVYTAFAVKVLCIKIHNSSLATALYLEKNDKTDLEKR